MKKIPQELSDLLIDDEGFISVQTATAKLMSKAVYDSGEAGLQAYLKGEQYGFFRPNDRLFLKTYSHNEDVRNVCSAEYSARIGNHSVIITSRGEKDAC